VVEVPRRFKPPVLSSESSPAPSSLQAPADRPPPSDIDGDLKTMLRHVNAIIQAGVLANAALLAEHRNEPFGFAQASAIIAQGVDTLLSTIADGADISSESREAMQEKCRSMIKAGKESD
jgi:hypothetical protein